jgi:hypothetical protein
LITGFVPTQTEHGEALGEGGGREGEGVQRNQLEWPEPPARHLTISETRAICTSC